MQGLCSISALFWAPEKAGLRPGIDSGLVCPETQVPPTMPPLPPYCKFFFQHTYYTNVQRDEGAILSHTCWGPLMAIVYPFGALTVFVDWYITYMCPQVP